jgi:D-tagatose-1,6-bisphosphate aldolase subunit GatZ/KbaZ
VRPVTAGVSGLAALTDALAANRRGEQRGVTSVCSAHPLVLAAAAERAARRRSLLCVESTASQVNQEGGYTGSTPAAFRAAVAAVAAAAGLPGDLLVVGGDHLGPFPWRSEPVATAMAKASTLVRDCALAGYAKLHLDASMSCADDPGGADAPLDEHTALARTVELCRTAEDACASGGLTPPVYVIGTEVPAPGGERAGAAGPSVTGGDAVARTLELARDAFAAAGLERAWERVVAVVAQPGVEFGDDVVVAYAPAAARGLAEAVRGRWPLVLEAHSTDYQTPAALAGLVGDGFAILKVGPWLTFAMREALFALEEIEREWLGRRPGVELSGLRGALEAAMLADPRHWTAYYSRDDGDLRSRLAFSFSDRCRYYWTQPGPAGATERLLRNLSGGEIPLELLSQYLPAELTAVREGELTAEPAALVRAHVGGVLDLYAAACGDA